MILTASAKCGPRLAPPSKKREKSQAQKRRYHSAAFKLEVVREAPRRAPSCEAASSLPRLPTRLLAQAMQRPVSSRIKPTCRNHPEVEVTRPPRAAALLAEPRLTTPTALAHPPRRRRASCASGYSSASGSSGSLLRAAPHRPPRPPSRHGTSLAGLHVCALRCRCRCLGRVRSTLKTGEGPWRDASRGRGVYGGVGAAAHLQARTMRTVWSGRAHRVRRRSRRAA